MEQNSDWSVLGLVILGKGILGLVASIGLVGSRIGGSRQRWALSPISVISDIGLSLISERPISD